MYVHNREPFHEHTCMTRKTAMEKEQGINVLWEFKIGSQVTNQTKADRKYWQKISGDISGAKKNWKKSISFFNIPNENQIPSCSDVSPEGRIAPKASNIFSEIDFSEYKLL